MKREQGQIVPFQRRITGFWKARHSVAGDEIDDKRERRTDRDRHGGKAEAAQFEKAYKASGKKLDMGKSCVRFKRLEDVPLEVIGEAIRRCPAKKYIAQYEAVLSGTKKSKSKPKKSA